MTSPVNTVYQNGLNQVSGDQFNTFVQWCTNVAALRTFSGTSTMPVFLEGTTSVNDGGQGNFYWNASGTAADDNGVTTVVPNGVTVGCWTRFS